MKLSKLWFTETESTSVASDVCVAVEPQKKYYFAVLCQIILTLCFLYYTAICL